MDTDLIIDTKKKVPSLRFAGFEGEWEVKKAFEVFKNHSNKSHNGDLPILAITQDKGAIPRDDLDMKIISSEASVKNYKVVEAGDFIISLRSFQGGIVYSNVLGICSPAYTILKPKIKIDNLFFKEYLKKSDFIQRLNGTVIGIRDGKQITYNAFSTLSLTFPTLPEQQKIASFLTAVDEKLQALKQQKNLLEQYKKGMMQKIFSQEICFKDDNGKEFGEWGMKKLGEIVDKKSSNISANKIEENTGRYIIYGASGILKKIDFYKEEDDYISIIKDGAGAGRLFYCLGRSSVLSTMEIITPKIGLNTYYLYCLLSNIDFTKYITGSTIPHIYFKDYSSEICNLPTLPEQTKIANFLSAIGEKISHCQVQITKMEQYKKGLLQQLFV